MAGLWSGVWARFGENPLEADSAPTICPLVQGETVELTGFQTVTSSLRKMRSKASVTRGNRDNWAGLGSACGSSDVRCGRHFDVRLRWHTHSGTSRWLVLSLRASFSDEVVCEAKNADSSLGDTQNELKCFVIAVIYM